MSKAEVRSPCAYLWDDSNAIQYVGKIEAYNIQQIYIFCFCPLFFKMQVAVDFYTSCPILNVTLCYMWIAQKLYNAVRLFLSWIKGYRKTHFWTRIQKDMWSSFLSIQILRYWCICRSQTLHIVKYETIRYTASQILRCLKTNQWI